jgi:hypothetical protein
VGGVCRGVERDQRGNSGTQCCRVSVISLKVMIAKVGGLGEGIGTIQICIG